MVFSTKRTGMALAAWLMLSTAALTSPVTAERLAAAGDEPANWLTAAGDLAGTHYSGLDMLNASNVGKLKFLFSVSLGPISVGENFLHTRVTPPLVDDGMAYVVDPFGVVYAIDVRSGRNGRIVWTSARLEAEMDPWLVGQWSLTLHGDAIILGAGDGRLFWIDRESGAVTRDIQVQDPATGYVLSAPPVLAGDVLVVGGAGGDRGARPEITGVDADTGDILWRHVLPGEAGPFVAGGSLLRTGVYDPASGLVLWSTSGPVPAYSESLRRGADLTNTILAIDADTGNVAWTKPLLEHDTSGLNSAATPVLIGNDAAVQVGEDGTIRRFEIATGDVAFAQNFVPKADAGEDGCPNVLAEPHMPSSFSAHSGLLYAAQMDGCRADLSDVGNLAGEEEGGLYTHLTTSTGALSAIDPATGETLATHVFDHPLQGGLLSTAGGLVFAETADGALHALDEKTLDTLWSLHVSSFMAAPPVTYAVGDRQFVAVMVGGGPLYDELALRTRNMAGVRHVAVMAVFGVEE